MSRKPVLGLAGVLLAGATTLTGCWNRDTCGGGKTCPAPAGQQTSQNRSAPQGQAWQSQPAGVGQQSPYQQSATGGVRQTSGTFDQVPASRPVGSAGGAQSKSQFTTTPQTTPNPYATPGPSQGAIPGSPVDTRRSNPYGSDPAPTAAGAPPLKPIDMPTPPPPPPEMMRSAPPPMSGMPDMKGAPTDSMQVPPSGAPSPVPGESRSQKQWHDTTMPELPPPPSGVQPAPTLKPGEVPGM